MVWPWVLDAETGNDAKAHVQVSSQDTRQFDSHCAEQTTTRKTGANIREARTETLTRNHDKRCRQAVTKEVVSYAAHLHGGVLGGAQHSHHGRDVHDDVKVCLMKMEVLALLKLLCSHTSPTHITHSASEALRRSRPMLTCAVCFACTLRAIMS